MSIDPTATIEEETPEVPRTFMEQAIDQAVEDRRAILFPKGEELTEEQRTQREEQLERYAENRTQSIEAATRNGAAGDVLLHAPEKMDWGIIMSPFKLLFSMFASFTGGDWSPLDRMAREQDGVTRFGRLTVGDRPTPSSEIAAPTVTADNGVAPRGLDGAQENLQREFPNAAAGTMVNLDPAPAPALTTTLKS